tara:strand:- start:1560 stop:3881 length:2322 start_codon:yes stop_codon:yes gene_type:complete
MIQTSEILSYLSTDDYFEIKKLEKALKLTKKNERDKLEIAIKALNKLNILKADDEGKVKLNDEEQFIKARIRCSSKGYTFGIREGEEEDIYIREQHLNHAWHDDIVLIKLHKEAQRRRSPEGIVLCILERNTSNIISFIKESEGKLIADPLDDRINAEVDLQETDKKYLNTKDSDHIVEVKINKYPIAQYKAEGEILRKLPLDKGVQGDLDILLTKANLQFDKKIPKFSLKDLSKTVRKELIDQPCLLLSSWDDPKAPCLPAFHVEQKQSGIRIWIHSPAVSERFNIAGKYDSWLQERGNSLCLGNTWRQLFNDEFTDQCNFEVNKITEAVSLTYDIDNEGKLLHWEFALTRIKPIAKVNRQQMEAIATRKPKARSIPNILKPIKEQIGQIQTLIFTAQKLSDSIVSQLDLSLKYKVPSIDNLTELKYKNPSNDYYGWNEELDISDPNSIISIFTLVADKVWFIHSQCHRIPTLSLMNYPIDNSVMNDIIKSALALNINIDLDENGYINPQNLIKSTKEDKQERIISKLFRQSVKNKNIFISNYPLIEENYNVKDNFSTSSAYTSPWSLPCLSYLNILNQYIIVLLLKEGKFKPKSRTTEFSNIAESDSWNTTNWDIFSQTINNQIDTFINQKNLNLVKKQVQKSVIFRESLIAMSKSREAIKSIGQIHEAYITGVQSYGFFAEIPPLMIEGLVHVSTLNDDWYEYRSRQTMLIGRKNKKTFQIGDLIYVKLLKVDLLRNQIDLEVSQDNKNCDSVVITEVGDDIDKEALKNN